MAAGRIRVGVGGWTYEPWRDNFYPKGLPHSRELHHASRRLTAIEVNGTYYRNLDASSFARWRDETPEGFVFALKANRFATTRRVLADSGEAIRRFVGSGLAQLGPKLGPILWQFMPTKKFEPGDLAAFLALLPREVGGLALRHVLEVRHPSFACDQYLDLARRHGCATVHTDSADYPNIVDAHGDLAYLRLMRSEPGRATGYPPDRLDAWAQGARAWVGQGPRKEVFAFFINGAKERAPAAACELIRRLADTPQGSG